MTHFCQKNLPKFELCQFLDYKIQTEHKKGEKLMHRFRKNRLTDRQLEKQMNEQAAHILSCLFKKGHPVQQKIKLVNTT